MKKLEQTLKEITSVNTEIAKEARHRVDNLAKPVGSMGKLEDFFVQLASIQGTMHPKVDKRAIVVLAADHGVTEEDIAASAKKVTLVQTINFARGVTGVCALAKQANARILPVDVGIAYDVNDDRVIKRKIQYGTKNMAKGAAMTREEAVMSLNIGIEMAHMLIDEGYNVLGTGEMGIGNTTPSAAIISVLGGYTPEETTGVGANLPLDKLENKINVVKKSIEINKPDPKDGIDVLSKVGGFEIGGMAGVMLGCASRNVPVIVDGFISSAAALIAMSLEPKVCDYMIGSHKSMEKGAVLASETLGIKPVLDMDMRLGEGTGASLMFNILEAAIYMSEEMITFDEAGILVV